MQDKHLIFGKYCDGDTLINNQYGIPEPCGNLDLINPKDLDMAIVPLVAFDKNGNRLGTGKGYYDRTFSFKKQKQPIKPYLFGIAYSFQQIENLSPQLWDIPLDFVVTDVTK